MNKSLILLCLFVVYAFAQFDLQVDVQPALSLDNTVNTNFHQEYSDTVAGEVVYNLCDYSKHTVNNVRTTNTLNNAGSYFRLSFTFVTNAVSVDIEFGTDLDDDTYDVDGFNILRSTTSSGFSGSVATCISGTCTYDYFCDTYPAVTPLYVLIHTNDGTSTTPEFATYNLTVTQFVEDVQIISGGRIFNQNVAVSDQFAVSNPGPKNYFQYYHDLNLLAGELFDESHLYVNVAGFGNVTGTAIVCVSFDGIISNEGATVSSSFSGNFTPANAPTPINSPNSPCEVYCSSASVSFGVGNVYVPFDICDDGLCGQDLWIGVRPPAGSPSTYEIEIVVDNTFVVPVTPIVSSTSSFYGTVSDTCVGVNGDYSCFSVYSIENVNTAPDVFLRIEVTGYAGSGDAWLSLDAPNSNSDSCAPCYTAIDDCSFSSTDDSCVMWVRPCDYNSTFNYILNIEGTAQLDAEFPIEFAIDITLTAAPVTNVQPTDVIIGQIIEKNYYHYAVTFTSENIWDDSHFSVELVPGKSAENTLNLAWNYNELAGDGSCYDNRGHCSTSLQCDDYDGSEMYYDEVAICRFLFLDCPIVEYQERFEDPIVDDDFDDDDDANRTDGLRVAQLSPGIYYFAIWESGSMRYNTEIDFTLHFNHLRSIPLYENVIALSSVYFLEYTPQYKIVVPQDASIGGVTVVIDNVQNGAADFYTNCGSLAGDCPCWDFGDKCYAIAADPNFLGINFPNNYVHGTRTDRCVLRQPMCNCESGIVYVSAQGNLPGNIDDFTNQFYSSLSYSQYFFGYDEGHPIYFTIDVKYHTLQNPEIISPIEASRAGSTVTGLLDEPTALTRLVFDDGFFSDFPSNFYRINFDNVDLLPTDTLSITLEISYDFVDNNFLPSLFGYYNIILNNIDVTLAVSEDIVPDLGEFFVGTPRLSGNRFTSCPFSYCVASANAPEYQFSYDFLSTCTVTKRPCYNDCGLDQSFNHDADYYISVSTLNLQDFDLDDFFSLSTGDLIDTLLGNSVRYNVNVNIHDNTPIPLPVNTPITGTVNPSQYIHFEYPIGSPPANSGLIFKAYANSEEDGDLEFFVNYVAQGSNIVYAGRQEDCYEHTFCPCHFDPIFHNNLCHLEISPNQLRNQVGGTYYISMYQVSHKNFYYNGRYGGLDYSYFAEGPVETHNHLLFNHPQSFTLEVIQNEIKPLLNGLVTLPYREVLDTFEGREYSITVPGISGNNVIGRVLYVTLQHYDDDTDTELLAQMSTTTPESRCRFNENVIDTNVLSGNIAHFIRQPCEREANVYYLSVFQEYVADDDDETETECEPDEFVVSAHVTDIINHNVALTSDINPRISQSYNNLLSTNPDDNTFILSYSDIEVFSFNVNSNIGDFLYIEINQVVNSGIPVDVYLSNEGLVRDPNLSGTSNLGLGSPDTSSCSSLYTAGCTFSGSTDCVFRIPACDLGNSQWFLTFGGNSMSPGDNSELISILIEQYISENILENPDEGSFVASPTTLTFDVSPNTNYYNYHTIDSLGLSAGDELSFTVSSASTLYVSHTGETDESCPSTCSTTSGGDSSLSCSVFTCSNLSPRVWYVQVQSNSVSATFTIERIQGSTNSTSVTTLPLNSVETFSSVPGTGFDRQFRYHRMSIPSSDSGRYILNYGGSANTGNVFFVDNAVVMPGFSASAPDVVIQSDGSSTGLTCGGGTLGIQSGTCCYDTVDQIFAVAGATGSYTLEVETEEFIDSSLNINLPSTNIGTTSTNTNQMDIFTFNLPANNDLYISFSVQEGSAEIYLNQGSLVGSGDSNPNPGFCWNNDNIVNSANFCNGAITPGNPCSGSRPSCIDNSCLNPNLNSYQYSIGIIASIARTNYTLVLSALPSTATLNLNSNSEIFPLSQSISDSTSTPSDDFAVFAQYVYTFNTSPKDIANFVPINNDPTLPSDLYPQIRFFFSNFRFQNNTPVSSNPFTIFISSTGPAGQGNGNCLGGDNIISGNTLLPCIENGGGADSTTDNLTCSINICDIGCDGQVYFGLARSASNQENYNFDISITEVYNELINNNETVIESRDISSSGSYTFNSNPFGPIDDETVYFKFSSNLNDNQYIQFEITSTVGTSSIDVDITPVSCGATFAGRIPVCSNTAINTTCFIVIDPCQAKALSIDSSVEGAYRITRSSGSGLWGFTLDYTVLTVSNIDSSLTILSSANPSYSAIKNIQDNQWHFYEFNINTNDGYSTFSVTVEDLFCEASGDTIQVYYSWGDDSTDYVDVLRPNRPATANCNNDFSTVGAPFTSYSMDTCEFNAGSYRVGIFAPDDTQLFQTQPLSNNENYFPYYSIEATLTTIPHIVMTGCSLTQSVSNFIPRIEVPIEATNRGAKVSFVLHANYADDDDDGLTQTNLYVGRDGFSEGTTTRCDLDTGYNYKTCSFSQGGNNRCTLNYNKCDYSDGIYYVYVDGIDTSDDSDVFTLSVEVDYHYIPVIDMINEFSFYEQHYALYVEDDGDSFKIISSSPFYISINNDECNECDLVSLFVTTGYLGFSADTAATDASYTCDNCDDCDHCVSSFSCTSQACGVFVNPCDFDTDTFFVYIENDDFDTPYCATTLTVQSVDDISPTALSDGVTECIFAPETERLHHYTYNVPSDAYVQVDIESETAVTVIMNTDTTCNRRQCRDPSCSFILDGCDYDFPSELDIYLLLDDDDNTCGDFITNLVVNSFFYDVVTQPIGSPLSSPDLPDFSSILTGSQFVVANEDMNVIVGSGVPAPGSSCEFCSAVLAPNTNYLIDSPSSTLELNTFSPNIATSTASSFTTSGDELIYFSYTYPAGSYSSATVYLEDIEFSNIDSSSLSDLIVFEDFGNTLEIVGSCLNPACDVLASISNSCENKGSFSLSSPCTGNTVYFAIGVCDPLTCNLDFTVRVELDSTAASVVTGTTHDTWISVDVPEPDCESIVPNLDFYVNSPEFLFVAVREVSLSSSVGVSIDSCFNSDSCTATEDSVGNDASCFVDGSNCHPGRCLDVSGDYHIAFTAPGLTHFEYQIVTQYVDITSFASSSIYGRTSHFYRITDTTTALTIELSISSGPALKMTVFSGCSFDYTEAFLETKMCHYGSCYTYIPTEAKQTPETQLYLVIDSQLDSDTPDAFDSDINPELHTKPTFYSIDVVRGLGNCASPPSTGFCANGPTGVNVWSSLSNSNVWNYNNPSSKDAEAECLYNKLIDQCVYPSSECREYLQVLACVSIFPQCDSNGYQMGTCQDLCLQVESVCGEIFSFDVDDDMDFFGLFACKSARYVEGSTGSCYTDLPVLVSTTSESFDFFADDSDIEGENKININVDPTLPFTLDTPTFSTIFATMPTIVLDDDDNFNNKQMTKDFINSSSSSSLIISTFFTLCLLFVALF